MIDVACKHRWEETDYGRKYLNEGTVVYMCKRCCEARLVALKPTQNDEKNLPKN